MNPHEHYIKKIQNELDRLSEMEEKYDILFTDEPFIENDAEETLKEIFTRDAEIEIKIAPDAMCASLIITPAYGGKHADFDMVSKLLVKTGVVTGIKFDVIHSLIEKAQTSEKEVFAVIAEGVPVTEGKDASYIELYKEKKKNSSATTQTIDYREWNTIETVCKNEKILMKIPAIPGKDGMSVTGKTIKSKPVKDIKYIAGENVSYDEETASFFALADGKVEIIGNTVSILPFYFVEGDVNMSVGNIKFNGNIEITGSVLDDFIVSSTKNIIIHGQVYAAEIHAQGNVTVMKGFLGRNKGKITAGNTVEVEFVENGNISAGGNILVHKASIHSVLKTSASVIVSESPGSIIGGSVFALKSITAVNIGNEMSVKTIITTGKDYKISEDIEKISAQKKYLEQAISDIQKILDRMLKNNVAFHTFSANDKIILNSLCSKLKLYTKKLQQLSTAELALKEKLVDTENSHVSVSGKLFPSVTLSIGNTTMLTKDITRFCKFSEDISTRSIKASPL